MTDYSYDSFAKNWQVNNPITNLLAPMSERVETIKSFIADSVQMTVS